MKIKRRWKVMAILPMIWCLVGLAIGIPLLEHGYDAWIEAYGSSLLLFGGWFIGTLTGVVIYHGAIDAEERENAEWKFQDNVFEHYEGCIGVGMKKDDAVNDTALRFDIAPSRAKNIVELYK